MHNYINIINTKLAGKGYQLQALGGGNCYNLELVNLQDKTRRTLQAYRNETEIIGFLDGFFACFTSLAN